MNQKKLTRAFLVSYTQSFFVALPISDLPFHGCGIPNSRAYCVIHFSVL